MRVEPIQGIFEVIPEEKRIHVYGVSPLSPSDYPHARVTSFGALPDGDLYALIFTRKYSSTGKMLSEPAYYVERFKDDGTMDSLTPIQTPPGVAHWFADLLAPFRDGNFLIAGTSTTAASHPSAGSWRPFTAIYDPTGRFVGELSLPDDVANNFKEDSAGKARTATKANTEASPTQPTKSRQFFSMAITTGGTVSGPDGNIWVLRASDPIRLYAVNSAGDVVEHFQFPSPIPGLTPFDFGFIGTEQIFLDFLRPPAVSGNETPRAGPSELIGVFNTVSNRFDALYDLPDEASKGFNALGCGDGNGGFLYLGSTPDNHLAVFDYAAR